ncbi:MAG TPA: SDR family oxidoreductase [Acidimicrobiia bacterium]|nr:SDR family oxidoreductase [Acidimicrobiia bacterium]
MTGATGYLGGRLVPQLLAAGHDVRCMVRRPAGLAGLPWHQQVEVVTADALQPESLDAALEGVGTAFYLIHSMDGGERFAARDRQAAENFRRAAERQGVRRIVYLGGLGRSGSGLSSHLASRQEVGRILGAGQIAVTEVRAAVIIGSGSVSFEMLRHLTEVLPVMITPSWVRTRCQPIAVRDVLAVLVKLLDEHRPGHQILEVGGPDVLTYQDMMQVYAEVAGLRRRLIIPVAVLSPSLSSRWVGLVTPVPTQVARTLIDSLTSEVVVTDNAAPALVGHPLSSYRQAVTDALERVEGHDDETRWSEAVEQPAARLPTDPAWAGARWMRDRQVVETTAPPEDVFWAVTRIGGEVGYYAAGWAWWLRGLIDRMVGGVGLRRGAGPRAVLKTGDTLDFWRVADVCQPRRLLLVAEMRLPGEAWLEFEVESDHGRTRLTQTAHFAPRGLPGRVYWYLMLPFHSMVFGPMARRLVGAAERRPRPAVPGTSYSERTPHGQL